MDVDIAADVARDDGACDDQVTFCDNRAPAGDGCARDA